MSRTEARQLLAEYVAKHPRARTYLLPPQIWDAVTNSAPFNQFRTVWLTPTQSVRCYVRFFHGDIGHE